MNYDQLIKHFGNQTRAAKAIGVNQSNVSLWQKKGIPFTRQFQIQVITGGILQADPPAVHTPSPAPAPIPSNVEE